MSKGNVLVTGGAGFLGYWLCDFLVREGFRVTSVDNLSSGDRKNLEHLDVEFIKHDARKPFNLGIKVDYIFHLASRASPAEFQKYPVDILLTNSLGTYNVLKFAEQNNARFVLTSTSEVYGDPLQYPQNEDYWGNVNPIGTRSCYDESKRFGEALCMEYFRKYNIPLKIVRPFNNYGPGLNINDKRVIPDFCNDVLHNRDIEILSDGKSTRTYCYISDAITDYMKILLSDYNGESFNIGNDKPEISVGELAEIITTYGKKSKVKYSVSKDKNYNVDSPRRRCPNIDKVRELLGYNQSVDIYKGIENSLRWYEDNK